MLTASLPINVLLAIMSTTPTLPARHVQSTALPALLQQSAAPANSDTTFPGHFASPLAPIRLSPQRIQLLEFVNFAIAAKHAILPLYALPVSPASSFTTQFATPHVQMDLSPSALSAVLALQTVPPAKTSHTALPASLL